VEKRIVPHEIEGFIYLRLLTIYLRFREILEEKKKSKKEIIFFGILMANTKYRKLTHIQ